MRKILYTTKTVLKNALKCYNFYLIGIKRFVLLSIELKFLPRSVNSFTVKP